MSNEVNGFQGWAIVEVMGHRAYAGHVSTISIGSSGMLRIDVPGTNEYDDACGVPRRPAFSKIVGAGSIFCITPCTKAAALAFLNLQRPRPLAELGLTEPPRLEPTEPREPARYVEDDDDNGRWDEPEVEDHEL